MEAKGHFDQCCSAEKSMSYATVVDAAAIAPARVYRLHQGLP